jgi:hypothetical protein
MCPLTLFAFPCRRSLLLLLQNLSVLLHFPYCGDSFLLHLVVTLDLLNMLLTRSSRLEMLEEARVAICLACLAVYFLLWHYDTLDCM